MKTKTFFSELTPPRHGGLLARFFALFFCLVMGMNVWGQTFSWDDATYTSSTKSYDVTGFGSVFKGTSPGTVSIIEGGTYACGGYTNNVKSGSSLIIIKPAIDISGIKMNANTDSGPRTLTSVSKSSTVNGTYTNIEGATISPSTGIAKNTCAEYTFTFDAEAGDFIKITMSGNWYYSSIELIPAGSSCSATAPGNISKGAKGSPLTLTAAGSPASGDTWYWQTASDGTSKTIQSGATYSVTTAGTYYVRSYNTSADCWSSAKSFEVTEADLVDAPACVGELPHLYTFADWAAEGIETTKTADCMSVVGGSGKAVTLEANSRTAADGTAFTKRAKLGGTGASTYRYITVPVPGPCTITLYGMSGSSGTTRTMRIDAGSFGGTKLGELSNDGNSLGTIAVDYTGAEATTIYVYSTNSGCNIYGIRTTAIATKHHVTYAKGEGTVTGTVPTQADVKEGATFTVAAKGDLARDGFDFAGWNDGSADYAAGATYTMGSADVVLTAQWQAAATKHTVIYMNGAEEISREDVTEGQKAANVPTPTKELNTFAGWEDAEHNAIDFATATINADLTVYAKWTPMGEATSIDIEQFVIDNTKSGDIKAELTAHNFDYNLESGDELDGLDDAKDYKNVAFRGLKMKHNGTYVVANIPAGKLVDVVIGNLGAAKVQINGVDAARALVAGAGSGDKTVLENYKNSHNYYYSETAAVLKVLSTGTSTTVLKGINFLDPFVVTFANGGEIDPKTFKGTAITLPAATGEGEFQGWFDAETEGNKIGDAGDEFTPTCNITLYAQFSAQSSDNSLKTLKYGETPIEIVADQLVYNVNLPYKSVVPASVTYEANSLVAIPAGEQTATVTDGTATFTITAENDDAAEYTVNFTVAPKDGISIIKATHTGATTASVEGLIGGTVDKNTQSGGKLGGDGHFFGIKLAEGTFQAGDVLTISASNPSATVQIFSDKGTNMLNEGVFVDNKYTFTLEAATEWIYLYRTSSAMNPTLGYMEVVRVMNPVLSALTVAGVDATIDEAAKTISVKLPNGTVAADAVLVPTIVANGGEPTAALAAALAYNTPVNYVVTDKDGDQTTYVLTATEAAAPAAEPVITVQPASHDYIDTEVIAALTVEASTTDAGVLSYQWYKGEEAIADATAASYTPTEAGSYKVVVTNTLGAETATATSEVAVITISHIYTFNDWDGSSVNFTKAGEWTMYSSYNSGKELAENQTTPATTFKADQQVNYAGATANVNYTNYVTVVFAKDMKAVQMLAYNSSSRTLNNIYTLDVEGKKQTDVTSKYTRNSAQNSTTKVSTMDATGHFEAGVYYVFKLSGSCNVFDFFATESAKVSEFAGLTAGKIGDADMTDAQLAELNGAAHTLTLTGAVSVAPVVKFTYKETETYDDSYVKTLASEENVEAETNRVGDNYEISKVIEGVTYKVVVPVDVTPALALDVTEGTAAIAGKTGRSKEFTVNLTGANLANGEYSVIVPAVDGLTVTPAAFTVAAGVVNETFTITYASDADVAEAVANIDFTVGAITATFALTYSSVAWTEQVNLEDVEGSMTWDFSKITNTGSYGLVAGDYTIYANTGISTVEGFDATKLAGKGQYAYRDNNKFFQGTSLKFHTTTPGMVKVYYRSTSSGKNMSVTINGKNAGSNSTGNFVESQECVILAGDVTVAFSGETDYARVNKIVFTAFTDADYTTIRTGLTDGKTGTMCRAEKILAVDGAVIYEVEKKNAIGVDLVEAEFPLVAGKPYIYQAEKSELRVVFASDAPATEVAEANGLVGNLSTAGSTIAIEAAQTDGKYTNYVFQNNHICYVATAMELPADRAYLNMAAVQDATVTDPVDAPARRRITMTQEGIQTPTAIDQVEADETVKFFENGNFYILRAGKLYNAQGQLVK